jgi:50S ribosomal protein L16 3-hydroxylase
MEGGQAGQQLRFFNGTAVENRPANWPRMADGSCDGYRERIERRLKGRDYLLIASGLQASFELWVQLANFLRGLFAITGIPPYTVEADSFLGNYRSTAFGVHRDEVGVLMSVIEGRKRMHFWHPEELKAEEIKRYGHDYAALLKRATTVEASPGDLVYWPARFWHVAEPAGYALTLHIGLGTHGGTANNPNADGSSAERISSAIYDLLLERGRGRDIARPLPLTPRRGDSTGDWKHAARALSASRASHSRLAHILVGRYLSRITALGFDPPPIPRSKSAPRQPTRLRIDPQRPILWQRVGGTLVVSANGHAFTAPHDGRLIRLLRRINAGAIIDLEGIPSVIASRDTAKNFYANLREDVLRRLYRLRALNRSRST